LSPAGDNIGNNSLQFMAARLLALVAAAASAASLRRAVNIDAGASQIGTYRDAAGVGVWIPVEQNFSVFYYNPVRGVSTYALPQGASRAKKEDPAPAEGGDAAPVAEGEAKPAEGEAKPAEAPEAPTTSLPPTIVPLDQRKSCLPHCTWNCTKPVCEQNCKPHCPVPECATKCPKLGSANFEGCKAKCGEPNCAMFCPPGAEACANGSKTLDCESLNCTTRCDEPKCELDCSHAAPGLGCKTECSKPACEWHCTKPTDCPKPECNMVCEQPPECAQGKLTVPVPTDKDTVSTGQAKVQHARWETSAWSSCSSQCGKGTQQRSVTCSSGHDEDCTKDKPVGEKHCEEDSGCRYHTGEWSECSSECGTGVRSRSVSCEGSQCHWEAPASEEKCVGSSDTCDACKVTIWGGKDFNGWEHSFEVGEYNSAELEYRGVKCDDISSLEVVGQYCTMKAYRFGDFNQAHEGWTATFQHGRHDKHDIEAAGARNNDISSFKVFKQSASHAEGGHGGNAVDTHQQGLLNSTLSKLWR